VLPGRKPGEMAATRCSTGNACATWWSVLGSVAVGMYTPEMNASGKVSASVTGWAESAEPIALETA
jgi:hypothetical protein